MQRLLFRKSMTINHLRQPLFSFSFLNPLLLCTFIIFNISLIYIYIYICILYMFNHGPGLPPVATALGMGGGCEGIAQRTVTLRHLLDPGQRKTFATDTSVGSSME